MFGVHGEPIQLPPSDIWLYLGKKTHSCYQSVKSNDSELWFLLLLDRNSSDERSSRNKWTVVAVLVCMMVVSTTFQLFFRRK